MTATVDRAAPESKAPSGIAKIVLLVGLVTYGMGHTLMFVIFGPVAIKLGFSELQLAIVLSISGFAIAVTAPWWGRQSNVWGRKNVFVCGLVGYAVGTFVFGLCLQAGLSGWIGVTLLFPMLMIARAAFGLVSSGIQPAATAYVADTTDASSRSQGMALIGVASGLGTILGPAMGGTLASFGLIVPLYTAAVLALLGAILAMIYLHEPPRHVDLDSSARLKLTDARVYPYLLLTFVMFMMFISLQTVTAFYLESMFGYSDTELAQAASMAIFGMAVTIIIVQAVFLQILKVRPKILIRSGLPFFAIGLLVIGLAGSFIVVCVGYALLGLAFSLSTPGISAAATLSVTPEEYGAASGLLAAAPTAGIIFGPIIGAVLYDIAPNLPMLFGAGVMVLLSIYSFTVKVPDPERG